MNKESYLQGIHIEQVHSFCVVSLQFGDNPEPVRIPCVTDYKIKSSSDGDAEISLTIKLKNGLMSNFSFGIANLEEQMQLSRLSTNSSQSLSPESEPLGEKSILTKLDSDKVVRGLEPTRFCPESSSDSHS